MRPVGPAPTRADVGLPDRGFVFCCFNGQHKISKFTFARWIEILTRAPDSILWLLDCPAEAKAALRAGASAAGLNAERLLFAPKLRNSEHLARYPLADLFLDTSPYGAHTTASDSLWMGVPVLTLSGRGFAARVCGSLVRSAGLPELVVETARDYVERAVALAHDPVAIQELKARLSRGRDTCTLFDTAQLSHKLDVLFREMVAAHQFGLTPQPDLRNLDAYLEAGLAHDHEAQEVLEIADYEDDFRDRLARRHWMRPLEPDSRLWTPADILAAELAAARSRAGGVRQTTAPKPTLLRRVS